MTIRIDSSESTHLAVCSKCPSFRALRSSKTAAWSAGATHERGVHPGQVQAQKVASGRLNR